MKGFENTKVNEETQSTEGKASQEEREDVDLALTSMQSNCVSWLIDFGASYHMTPLGEWFQEYEKFGWGDVLLRGDSSTSIVGWGKV